MKIMEDTRIHEKTKYKAIDKDGNEFPVDINEKTGEIKIKNPHFIQFYKKNFILIRRLFRNNSLAGELFLFFTENMDNTNAIIVSYEALQEIYEKSRPTIYQAIKYLKDNKYIDIQKSGNMNIYCINADLVWTQSREKIKFAKFNATVYLSENEQAKTKRVFHTEIKSK